MSKKSKGIDRLITFSRTPMTGGNPSGRLYKPPPSCRGSRQGGYSFVPCLRKSWAREMWSSSPQACRHRGFTAFLKINRVLPTGRTADPAPIAISLVDDRFLV